MEKWTVEDVVEWVKNKGQGQAETIAQIRDREMNGETLIETARLGNDVLQAELKELGLVKTLPRTGRDVTPNCAYLFRKRVLGLHDRHLPHMLKYYCCLWQRGRSYKPPM